VQRFLLGIFILAFLCASAKAQNKVPAPEFLLIPDAPRLPLWQQIPLNGKPLITIGLWDKEGVCYSQIFGNSAIVDIEMKAPCDVMTKGAANSFIPLVEQNKKTDGLLEISFEVAGDLKYYPAMRAECSKKYKTITIKWVKGSTKANVVVSNELDADTTKSGIKCPRAYN
jgi:hypothetical protein